MFLCFGTVSCRTEVKGLAFRDAAGAETRLFVESGDGFQEGGTVNPGKATVRFSLKTPVETSEGSCLRLRLERGVAGATVEATGTKAAGGEYAASSRLPDAGNVPTEFLLSLPAGRLAGFSFKGLSADAPSFRLLEVGIGTFESRTLIGKTSVKASSDLVPLSYSRTEGRLAVALRGRNGRGSLAVAFRKAAVLPRVAPKLVLEGEGKRYTAEVLLRPVEEPFFFHPGGLGFTPDGLEIEACPDTGVSLSIERDPSWEKGAASFSPLPMDLGSILDYPHEAWRNGRVEVFRWTLFPTILVFGTPSYEVQNRFFHRLAFFIEKAGYRGRLMPDAEIQDKHGWNAHNYSAEGLSSFFEKARETSFPLHEEEVWLRDYLAASGVLRKEGDAYLPGKGGILAFSIESAPAHRRLLLTHEAFHGIFYNLPEYRRLAETTWKQLPAEEKDFWRYFFAWMNYDVRDPYLAVNEFQAYLLQQPLKGLDRYYKETILNRITEKYPDRRQKYEALFEKSPDMFARPAKILQDHLAAGVGIRAGNVFSLFPERK